MTWLVYCQEQKRWIQICCSKSDENSQCQANFLSQLNEKNKKDSGISFFTRLEENVKGVRVCTLKTNRATVASSEQMDIVIVKFLKVFSSMYLLSNYYMIIIWLLSDYYVIMVLFYFFFSL